LVYNISLLDLIFAAIIFGLQLLQSSPIVIICGYLCKYCDHLWKWKTTWQKNAGVLRRRSSVVVWGEREREKV